MSGSGYETVDESCVRCEPGMRCEGFCAPSRSVSDILSEIIGHLGASIIQSAPADDQIIMDHVKAAHELAKAARRQLKVSA